jgi:hypothetical protein
MNVDPPIIFHLNFDPGIAISCFLIAFIIGILYNCWKLSNKIDDDIDSQL